MNHTAQDLLDAANQQNFPYPFTIDDAQKVLDASPERIKIGRCYFIWDDVDGTLTINCPEEPKLDHRHPADPRASKSRGPR